MSLPSGTAQGQIALGSASGGAPSEGDYTSEFTVLLSSASEAQGMASVFCRAVAVGPIDVLLFN